MGLIAPVAVACWAVLVFCNWWPAFVFKPLESLSAFSPQPFPLDWRGLLGAMAVHLKHALSAGALLLSVRGWGCMASRMARPPREIPFLRFCLGLAVFSGAVLGAGLAGLLHAPVLWAVMVAGIIMGGIPRFTGLFPRSFPRPALAAVALACIPALFSALAPEVTYDALSYHLGAPEQWLKAGRIVRLEHMFFSDFPLVLQSVYLAGIGTGGGTGATKLVHFALGIFCVGAAARLGEKAGGRIAGGWTAVFMAGAGLLTTQMGKANVDLGVALATMAGLMVLLESRSPAGVLAGGLCFGVAAGVKLTGGIGAVAGLFLLARRGPASWTLFSAGVLFPLIPWLARTWLGTGNPVYPFLLGGLGWDAGNASAYRFDMTGPTSFNIQYPDFLARLAGPWTTFMHDRGGEAALGMFTLAMLPLAVILRKSLSRVSRAVGLFAVVYWSAWFAVARDPRFFLPALPACAVFSAALLVSVQGNWGRLLAAVFGAWALFAPFQASRVAYRTANPGPVVWGAMDRAAYENAVIPAPNLFVPMARVASSLPVPGRILVVGDVKAAHISSGALYQSMFDTPHIEAAVRESRSVEGLDRWFRQRRIGAVLFNPGGAAFLRSQFGHFRWAPRERAVLAQFWKSRLYPFREFRDGGELVMGIYLVEPRAGVSIPLPGDSK